MKNGFPKCGIENSNSFRNKLFLILYSLYKWSKRLLIQIVWIKSTKIRDNFLFDFFDLLSKSSGKLFVNVY